MEKLIKRNKIIIIIMFTIGIIGLSFLSYDYILSKIRQTFESVNLNLFGNSTPKVVDKNSKEENKIIENQTENTESKTIETEYYAYLEIPKINLKQGLVPMDSKENNVDMNIQTIYPSNYPDVVNGNLILAAHSGSSNIAYFKNLYKLKTDDKIYIIYNGEKYTYNIVNIYTSPKNGKVSIYRNADKNVVTLITCTKNDDTTQTVYISELIGKEVI